MQRRVLRAVCVGLSLAMAPALGWAQESGPSDEARAEAEALVERAIALRRSGEDAQALPLFQEAEQLDPASVRVLVHLAAAHQALGQWEAADRYLTRALAEPSDPYIQKHQGTLAAARRTIDAHIGQLRVSGGPRGTEIRLNGRLIGTLPLEQAARIEAGIYTLEARLPGHYPVTRSVALAGGTIVQESIELSPLSPQPPGAVPVPAASALDEGASGSGGATWLTWTFGGLAAAAGAVTVGAWVERERHADRWNDDARCTSPNETREQLCGSELRDGERAETLMWIGGAAAVAFTGAAIGTLWIGGSKEAPEQISLRCGVGLAQLACAGRF